MKKNLIVALALVFVLGIAGTAFAAANPFVDVPAKHWAYDAVTKLAQAGILDGYNDGTYRGERLATRYEMAQATAKAMARADKADAQMKGLIDKLAVEFAAELNNLGVRVAKLEKNASSIKFTGDARVRYQTNTNFSETQDGATNAWSQRIRLNAAADLNDKVSFAGRIVYEGQQAFENGNGVDANANRNGTFLFEIGQFNFKQSPTTTIMVGRMAPQINNSFVSGVTGKIDGVVVAFGDPLKVQLGYADWAGKGYGLTAGGLQEVATSDTPKVAYWADLTYAASKDWSFFGSVFQGADLKVYPYSIFALGAQATLAKDWTFKANYAWNTAQEAKNLYPNDSLTAWAGQVQFKGANKAQVGTWGVYVNYRDIKPMAMDYGLQSGILGNDVAMAGAAATGFKGWGFQADYTISKNVILTATYFSLNKSSNASTAGIAPTWYVQANMWF